MIAKASTMSGETAAGRAPRKGQNGPVKGEGHSILRVFMVSPYGPFGRGGIDRLVDLITESVAQHTGIGVQIVRLPTRGHGSIVWSPYFLVLALVRLWFARRRREVDVLHIHLSKRGSTYRKLLIAALARHLEIPYVVHLHSGLFDRFWSSCGASLRRAIDRLFMDSAQIVVLGRYWAGVIEARLPQVKDKIIVLPNATLPGLPGREPSPDRRIRITFLGKLGHEKGTPELLQALKRLADRDDWTATLAGNGDIAGSRLRAQEFGIANRMNFPGWLDTHAVARLLQQTDVFVLPSHIENLPMSLLEAFSYGIASIATPVGAVSEVLDDGRNGLLVPVGDADALARALVRLMKDPKLRTRLGSAALRDHADRYDISGYIMRLATIWRRATNL